MNNSNQRRHERLLCRTHRCNTRPGLTAMQLPCLWVPGEEFVRLQVCIPIVLELIKINI